MRIVTIGLVIGLVSIAGCRVDRHSEGKDNDVKIATPFGGMSVNTNPSAFSEELGLTPYPGATLVKKAEDHDDSAADVNLSFGSIHFGVKAISYETHDSADKVEAFYRKDLARYGSVVLCQGNAAVGKPERTQDGLGCDGEKNSHVQVSETGRGRDLKAGSHQHQHIVSIEPRDGQIRIGLVSLDLPGHFSSTDSDSKQ